MAQRLKRWESPRKEGRNSKGKGGSARQRQIRKQMKALSQKLKQNPGPSSTPQRPAQPDKDHTDKNSKKREESQTSLPSFILSTYILRNILGRILLRGWSKKITTPVGAKHSAS